KRTPKCGKRPITCGPILAKSRCGDNILMSQPHGFSWIEKPLLAALARPEGREELEWLRPQGREGPLSLTEEPPSKHWVEEAGLLLFHVPMEDMEAPDQEQIDRAVSAITRANEHRMG